MIFSIFIFLLIYFIFLNPSKLNQSSKNKPNDSISIFSRIVKKDKNNFDSNSDRTNIENLMNDSWYIEIPSISLKAPISSSVDMNTLQNYVGHFDETSLNYGNVGLAAHNRRI